MKFYTSTTLFLQTSILLASAMAQTIGQHRSFSEAFVHHKFVLKGWSNYDCDDGLMLPSDWLKRAATTDAVWTRLALDTYNWVARKDIGDIHKEGGTAIIGFSVMPNQNLRLNFVQYKPPGGTDGDIVFCSVANF